MSFLGREGQSSLRPRKRMTSCSSTTTSSRVNDAVHDISIPPAEAIQEQREYQQFSTESTQRSHNSLNGEVQIVPLSVTSPAALESGETFIEMASDCEPLLDRGGQEGADETDVIEEREETFFSILLQVFLPYIIAGFGTVGAGLVLDAVQHWPVFTKIPEIFIMVPSLLGLKGNLEMTLASRLSTQANLGNMDKKSEQWKMIAGNMALIQAQAIVVGFLASLVAMVMDWIPEGKWDVQHGLLLCASSMSTASLASFILGSVMVAVVIFSRKFNINPDNVATPIAASLGDLTTLTLLSGLACVFFRAIQNQLLWLSPVVIALFFVLVPFWVCMAVKNKYTNDVIYSGWSPVLCSMVISSLGGLILDFTVKRFSGIAVFQPVINGLQNVQFTGAFDKFLVELREGVGGNLVAVQASRISTSLHKVGRPGNLPEGAENGCPNCPSAFFGKGINSKAARVLMVLVIPGHLIFMYTIGYLKAGHTSITPMFALIYLTAAVLQVTLLLYTANWMVHFVWKCGDDPDNVAIPYLTALGDLLGTGFLAIAFELLYLIGDEDADFGE